MLTFDDGPMPGLTRQILDTLDQFCTKATFFHVGRMAIAHPGLVKEVIARGHTVGTHTWSHPLNLRRHSAESARAEIEKGFAATTLAAGEPISPFFRFPGLNDSPELLTYLQARGVATFTVDVISDDSYIMSTERLIQTTLNRVEARNGGILLFHDIKAATARALPQILAGLESRGFKVVHLLSSTKFQPDVQAMEALAPVLARASPSRAINVATAFAQPSGPIPITRLAPAPRVFGVTRFAAVMDKRRARDTALTANAVTGKDTKVRSATASYKGPVLSSPWATSIKRPKRVSSVQ